MTLPNTLLPSGTLNGMRYTASQFMTTPIILYEISKSYTVYGEPIEASGVIWSGLCYIGDVSARDLDLLRKSDFYTSRNDGVELKYLATILIPFEVQVDSYDKMKVNGVDWEIIWNNNATSNAVQVYTKLIVRDKRYENG